MHPLGFFYNKTVMEKAGLDPEKPPTNAEEYGTALDALKSKGIEGHWATPFPFTGSMTVQSLLWQFGGELFSADATRRDLGGRAGVQGDDLVHRPGQERPLPGQDRPGRRLHRLAERQERVQLERHLDHQHPEGEERACSGGWRRCPTSAASQAAWAGSHQFVLPTQKTPDENKSTASRVFLNWISQQSLEWAKAGQVPARNSVRESAEFKALKDQATLGAQINDLHFPPPVAGIGDAMLEWEKALNEAVLGTKDPQAALSDAAGRANKILEANKQEVRRLGRHGRPRPSPPARRARPPVPAPTEPSRFGGVHGSRATPYLFLLPYLVLFLTFVAVPAVFGIWISLHNWDFLLPGKPFVGLDNYTALVDPTSVQFEPFWHSMRATAIFTVASVPFLVTIPLGLAVLLNRSSRAGPSSARPSSPPTCWGSRSSV